MNITITKYLGAKRAIERSRAKIVYERNEINKNKSLMKKFEKQKGKTELAIDDKLSKVLSERSQNIIYRVLSKEHVCQITGVKTPELPCWDELTISDLVSFYRKHNGYCFTKIYGVSNITNEEILSIIRPFCKL